MGCSVGCWIGFPIEHSDEFLSVMSRRLRCAKGKAMPGQVYYMPRGFQEVEAPKFRDDRHITVRLSALLTGRLYTPGNIPGTQRVG